MNTLAMSILKGSRAIDQKRKDINDLVCMLEGLVLSAGRHAGDGVVFNLNGRYGRPEHEWVVTGELSNTARDCVTITFKTYGITIYSHNTKIKIHPDSGQVDLVHEHLDSLIQGLRNERLPGFRLVLDVYVKAGA